MGGNSDYDKYITVLRPNDVLFGRGSGPNDHEGNIRFRSVVSERKPEYLATNRRQAKAQIAKEIVDSVLSKNGRFLKRADAAEAAKKGVPQGLEAWVKVDDNMIMEKAKQALRQNREKMPILPAIGGDGSCQPQIDPSNPLLEHHTLSGITPYPFAPDQEATPVPPDVKAEVPCRHPTRVSVGSVEGPISPLEQPLPRHQGEVVDLYEPIPLTSGGGQSQADQLYLQEQQQMRQRREQQQQAANMEAWSRNYSGPPTAQQRHQPQQQQQQQQVQPLPQTQSHPEPQPVQEQNPTPYAVVSTADIPAVQLLQDPRIAELLKGVPLEEAVSSIEAARSSVISQQEAQQQTEKSAENGNGRRRQSTKVVVMEDLTENMRRMSTQSMATSIKDMFSESEWQDSNTTMGTIEQIPGNSMSRRSFSYTTEYAGIKSSQSLNSSGSGSSSILRDDYDKQAGIPENSNEEKQTKVKPREPPEREDSQTAFVINQIMENQQLETGNRNDISNISMQMSDIWRSNKKLTTQNSSKGIVRKDSAESPPKGGWSGSQPSGGQPSSGSIQPRPVKAMAQDPDSMRLGDSSMSVMKSAMVDSVDGFSSSQLSISSEQMEALIRETSRKIS